ncbi:MAG: DUF1206 domain-containing protein [Planctomycetota bacterium]|nr:MAG: DUF1206 domain-containing protein [Planctomycetota bacterium]REK20047.1 MAG: DUF1206 domain-containing protein [Planctomycetota bacterium]REK27610.1 MAG: DUF1206 domain-containing protein [Planctomycetota bacterium]
MARCGYAAKGLVYAVIGGLAIQIAFGSGGETTGPRGALSEIGSQPLGQFLLVIVGIGLFGYAAWRFVQAGFDPEHKRADAKGIAVRAGYVCSGVVYTLLGVEAIRLVVSSAGSSGGGGQSAEHWTAWLMQQPFGQVLVGLVGLAIIGTGAYQCYRAATADFQKMLKSHEMSATEVTWSERTGRAGFAARGVVYFLIGGGLMFAAVTTDPSEAIGIGQALSRLSNQSFGPWLLGLVAIGLIAYGLFSGLILCRYRRIIVPRT